MVVGLALAVSGGNAADIGDSDLQMIQVYYQPTLMASADEAIAALNMLHDSYCDWRGGRPTAVFATKAHVDMHTNIHFTEQSTQWVPSWGGVIGPGGSYTPYMGGSNQTSQSDRDEGADVSVTPAQITTVSLWSYPNLERDFKYGFDLTIKQADGKMAIMSFRTSTIDIAHRLGDAFATLAAANFTAGERFAPSWGIRQVTKNAPEKLAKLGWTQPTGVVVEAVIEASPAAAAGLQRDDIIFEAAGQPVSDLQGLSQIGVKAIAGAPTVRVPFKVFRGGQTIDLTASLTDPNIGIDKLLSAPSGGAGPIHLGIAVRALTPAEAETIQREQGVMVGDIDKGSLAEQMSLQPGDILIAVNGKPVDSTETLKQLLATVGEIATITVVRAGKTITLTGISKM
jgi:hypothetical protein